MDNNKRYGKKDILFHSIICISLIDILLLAGCSALFRDGTPTPIARHAWITEWLEKKSDIPPCWETICPGKTNETEVVNVLNQLHGLARPNGRDAPQFNIWNSSIQWNFKNSTDRGEISFNEADGLVATIALFIEYGQKVTIGEVIDSYGEPSDILIYYCRDGQCLVELIFMDKGFVVETITDVKQKKAVVTNQLIVYSIWFFANKAQGYRDTIGLGKLESGYLYKWDGYKNYVSTR